MSKVVVEEINKIELDSKTWWQPEIDKKTFKNLLKTIDFGPLGLGTCAELARHGGASPDLKTPGTVRMLFGLRS